MSLACTRKPRSTETVGTRYRLTTGCACRFTVFAFVVMLAIMPPIPVGAAERWYMVEIIVFDDLRNDGLHTEHWPADPGEPPLQGTAELTRSPGGGSNAANHTFRLVAPSNLSLRAIGSVLRGSEHYRPFLHIGWRIPGRSHGAARPAHVSPGLADSRANAARRDSAERPAVEGTVKVSLARYLHVALDLLYHRPAMGENAAPGEVPARFRLVSERRMRSSELHYIDHPLFGVLVMIRPLQAAS